MAGVDENVGKIGQVGRIHHQSVLRRFVRFHLLSLSLYFIRSIPFFDVLSSHVLRDVSFPSFFSSLRDFDVTENGTRGPLPLPLLRRPRGRGWERDLGGRPLKNGNEVWFSLLTGDIEGFMRVRC